MQILKFEYLSKLVVRLVRHGKAVQQYRVQVVAASAECTTDWFSVVEGGAGLSAIGMVTRHPSVDVAVSVVGANP